jgi:hypoxanthine phosphoribosyltransferase
MAAVSSASDDKGANVEGMAMSCPEDARQAPIWVSDTESLPMDSLLIPMHYEGMIESILVPKGLIADRIEKLAQTIRRDYDGVTVHLLCILKGGSAFFEELCNQLRAIHRFSQREYVPFTFDFVKVSSYKGLSSSGQVSVSGMDLKSLEGKHCLLVEDIIDTGRTMTHLLPLIKRSAAVASLKVATLLEKRTPKSCGFKAQYCGFSIPDKFVIGYNLDYNDAFRDMGHICIINQAGIEHFAEGIKAPGPAAAAADDGSSRLEQQHSL